MEAPGFSPVTRAGKNWASALARGDPERSYGYFSFDSLPIPLARTLPSHYNQLSEARETGL